MNIVYKMISVVLFSLILTTVSIAKDLDQRWIYFSSNGLDFNFYYDSQSIVHLPNGIVKDWIKSVIPKTMKPEVTTVASELRTLYEINCDNRTYRVIQMEGTRRDGSAIVDFEQTSWSEISPNSWMEALYTTLCKSKR